MSKYADHLPLYRQCQIYARGGVNLDRSTLASWCGVSAYHLGPIVDRMLVHLKRSSRLFMDETRAPVLDPKAGKTKTGYLWVVTRDDRGWGGGDPPAVVFTYAPGRHGHHAMDILVGFDGILQVDGYTGYDALAGPKRVGGMPLTLAYCWAHSRRKLHDIYQKDGSEIAAEGLRRIAQLNKIEASVRGQSPEERQAGYYAQCRYGTRVLMLHGKSNAVFVDKLEQVAEVLAVFRTAALAGDFDRAVLLVKSRSSWLTAVVEFRSARFTKALRDESCV